MKKFTWKTLGNGEINLIILNGWGMSHKIWFFIMQKLSMYFKLHLIDLPGIGVNKNLNPTNMEQTIEILNFYMPKNSVYLGWSLGGLIATNFTLLHPKKTLGLINISSSPYFIKQKNWPGIEKKDLYDIYNGLLNQYKKTINNFLSLQMSKQNKHFQDLEILKKILSNDNYIPNRKTLKKGLEILLLVDLRFKVSMITVPFLRIYGALDTLVPKKISSFMDLICPNSDSIIIEKAGHAPFISHKEEFCSILLEYFSKKI
ncbi:pimeloyl-ACP methyl ester esterase BioH [Buchnera aphidicola]|uniref:Pimeloyl-[acyl-carrier protein] methyl ester esterase n=1 Tax=Buchnera aphidicola (Aphis gossypii) TaxID=98785 RepID=A0A5J6ZCF4_9GAMM|nr:pimeloyl-ACP methyl ester esterase BioH [Buchnera aphidicola]QFQ32348.1 pimeloyl-ACP methyl ester esterase BioH [Buchnera aphidicola (Aphis gossypii)]UPT14870.1 pimeloyl-ACP methyl ester esterase BioH [Buchnera aphidicola (Aphis gossypii)]